MDFPPRDYAYVPDPLLPATWKLRLTETPGKVTEAQLMVAAASLSPTGFRGNRLEIPAQTLASVKQRLKAEFRRLKVDESRIPMSIKEVEEEDFLVWKDVSTGLTRWFAIYSNHFRDQDNPSEIISTKSQETYVELVDAGIVDYPELWLWHVKGTAWGKADWVAYAHGFAMASGLVYPGYEYIAKNLSKRKDLRVSHGMIKPLLVYDPHDKSVIIFHITAEISPLPGWAAANMLTGFSILDEGASEMAAKLPDAKKSFLKEAGLSEDVLNKLDENLEKAASLATESGLESKEASDEEDADAEIDGFDTSELAIPSDESEEEEVPAVKETVKVAAKAKPYPMAEEIEEETPPKKKVAAKKKEAAADVEPSYVTREEVAEALGTVLTPMLQTIETLTSHVATLTKEITELKKEDADKIAATKELTPTLSLSELINRNVIGKEASKVKGNTVLGKDGPKETEASVGPPPTMVPFINDMFKRSSLGSA